MEDKERKREDKSPVIVVENMLRAALLLIAVLALGFLFLNQAFGFYYKAHFLKGPCNLCADLNPEVKSCIINMNAPRPSYWINNNGIAGWSYPFAKQPTYNITP